MKRFRKILVPVNFSDDSANRLNYAASLAEETQSELVVLYVTQKEEARSFVNFLALMEGWPMLNNPTAIPVDRLVREKALDLYHFIEKVIRNPGRLKIRRKVALGHEQEKILRVAREEDIDLVVLGILNKSLFSNLMTRAKFLKTISRLPCPVLLRPALENASRSIPM